MSLFKLKNEIRRIGAFKGYEKIAKTSQVVSINLQDQHNFKKVKYHFVCFSSALLINLMHTFMQAFYSQL